MEDLQLNLSTSNNETIEPLRELHMISSPSSSPEHSRARSKKSHTYHQATKNGSRPQIRRRQSQTDGTRRGRSSTRSMSPESAKRRTMRRRRSRSPSRSCSTSATERQSPVMKKQRKGQDGSVSDEHAKNDTPGTRVRDESRDSIRSRSKRRRRYRRRSDHAASTAAEIAEQIDLRNLRDRSSVGVVAENSNVHRERKMHGRMESFESVLEEDEEVGEKASER